MMQYHLPSRQEYYFTGVLSTRANVRGYCHPCFFSDDISL